MSGAGHVWLPYTQMLPYERGEVAPEIAVRTEGCRIQLKDGRWLIDGVSSWWTACHGYNHPHIVEAVKAQVDALPHVMLGGLVHQPALKLAERLSAMLPGDLGRVFFAESGSVSVEVALKMALQFQMARGRPNKRRFVAFEGGYHGDTFATMSVCDPEEGMHSRFKGALLEQHILAVPTEDALPAFAARLAALADDVAAVVMEPLVQCAGGFRMHSPAVLRGIRQACDAADVLLILDEIATGFMRTGTMFACEQADVVPDIITLSKALTGGVLPLSAAIAREHVYEAFLDDDPMAALMHGPTFMGNALGCAAANASLDVFEREPRKAQVAAIEQRLAEGLEPCRSMAGVVDVRVKGAIGVVELDREASGLRSQFIERGLWVRPFGRSVYLMPPFVIADDELEALLEGIRVVVGALD
jgi:adenosylmethionine-8-amino-7-oxononanoate aminotransferase